MIPVYENASVSVAAAPALTHKKLSLYAFFARFKRNARIFCHADAPALPPLPFVHSVFSPSSRACIPSGMVLSSKNRLGEPSWLRKGCRALTPRTAQKNAVLHLTRIVPTKGSWLNLETGLCLPAAVLVLRVFFVPLKRPEPHARSPKQAL